MKRTILTPFGVPQIQGQRLQIRTIYEEHAELKKALHEQAISAECSTDARPSTPRLCLPPRPQRQQRRVRSRSRSRLFHSLYDTTPPTILTPPAPTPAPTPPVSSTESLYTVSLVFGSLSR